MPTTTSTTTQSFAPEFKPLATDVANAARAQMRRKYIPYTGIRTVGFTPVQKATQAGIMALATPAEFSAAGTNIAGSTDTITAPGALTGYINPFNVNVTDVTARQMMRDAQIQQTMRDAQFAKAGAFGGSRHGIADAEAMRNLNQQLQDIQFKGNAAAYQAAIDQFNKENDAQLAAGTAQTNLGSTQRMTDLSTFDAKKLVGEQQQNLKQAQADVAYQDFLAQRDWAKNNTGWAANILQGAPFATTSTQTTSGGSRAAQNFGTIVTLLKLFSKLL